MKKLFPLLAIVSLLISCKKENTGADKKVEFYLLESFRYVTGQCKVDAMSAVMKATPFIGNDDIIQYSRSAYTYKLSAAAINRLKAFEGRVPFAVTVNKEVIYYGFFNDIFLSSSCEHSISMNLDWGSTDKILLQLGYPGSGVTVNDQRNNTILLAALGSQGKLK